MAYIIELKNYTDNRGTLNVIQEQLPFAVKRAYWIYGVPETEKRGGHRHHYSTQALFCLGGACTIFNHDGETQESFRLDSPQKVLIVEPKDWHIMHEFTANATLMVFSSTAYDVNDYIDEAYPNTILP
jgi:hypothetical protein